jgi:hypothetical protein
LSRQLDGSFDQKAQVLFKTLKVVFAPQKFRLLMNVIKYIFLRLMFEDISNFNITNPEGDMTLQRLYITAILRSQDKLVVFLAFLE